MTNLDAAQNTIAALRATGRLELVDAALEAAFLSLAQAVDDKPGDAGLWREYRSYELRLRATGGGDDDLARLLAGISGDVPSKVGDAPKA